MKEFLKSTLLIALCPTLLALHAITGEEGWYNLAAAWIVGVTILTAVVGAALYFFASQTGTASTMKLPEKPKVTLTISRTISIFITLYLIFTGHWVIALFSTACLALSFVIWAIIEEVRKDQATLIAASHMGLPLR